MSQFCIKMDTSNQRVWFGGRFHGVSLFFLLLVEPKGLIIPNENDHLSKQWLNIFLFHPEEAEVAGIVVQISYSMCSQTICSYILFNIFSGFTVRSAAQTCTAWCTTCQQLVPAFVLWPGSSFAAALPEFYKANTCCVKHNSSRKSFYQQTLHVLGSL